jgi:hypothetical protein
VRDLLLFDLSRGRFLGRPLEGDCDAERAEMVISERSFSVAIGNFVFGGILPTSSKSLEV